MVLTGSLQPSLLSNAPRYASTTPDTTLPIATRSAAENALEPARILRGDFKRACWTWA